MQFEDIFNQVLRVMKRFYHPPPIGGSVVPRQKQCGHSGGPGGGNGSSVLFNMLNDFRRIGMRLVVKTMMVLIDLTQIPAGLIWSLSQGHKNIKR